MYMSIINHPTFIDFMRLTANAIMIYQCYSFGKSNNNNYFTNKVLEWLWADTFVYTPISIIYHTIPDNLQLEFIDMLAVISRMLHIPYLVGNSYYSWKFYYITPLLLFIDWIGPISQSKLVKCAIYGPIYLHSTYICRYSHAHIMYSIGILLWCLYYNYTLLHVFSVVGDYYVILFECDLKLCCQKKKDDDYENNHILGIW